MKWFTHVNQLRLSNWVAVHLHRATYRDDAAAYLEGWADWADRKMNEKSLKDLGPYFQGISAFDLELARDAFLEEADIYRAGEYKDEQVHLG